MRRKRNRTRCSFVSSAWRLFRDNRAATAVEYGLIIAVIVIAMLSSFMGVAQSTKDMWNNISTKVITAR